MEAELGVPNLYIVIINFNSNNISVKFVVHSGFDIPRLEQHSSSFEISAARDTSF